MRYSLIAVNQYHEYTEEQKQDLKEIALQIKAKYLNSEHSAAFSQSPHILQDVLNKYQNLDVYLDDQLFSDMRGFCETQLMPVYEEEFKIDPQFQLMRKSILAEELFENLAIPWRSY